MQGNAEAVQTTAAGDPQDIAPDFSLEELLDELEQGYEPLKAKTPYRTPGGLDKYLVATQKGCSMEAAREWLQGLEKLGKLTSRIEYDEQRGARLRVWRKAERSVME